MRLTLTWTQVVTGTLAGSLAAATLATAGGVEHPRLERTALTNLGKITFDPPTGSDLDKITLGTVSDSARATKGCPAGSTNVKAIATGPGDWAKGIYILPNTRAGVSNTADFTEPQQNPFSNIAADNSIKITAGKYDISMICQNSLGTTQSGEFTTSIWFTDATHYQSTDPASTTPSTTATSSSTTATTSSSSSTTATTTSTTATTSSSSTTATTTTAPTTTTATTTTAPTTTSTSSTSASTTATSSSTTATTSATSTSSSTPTTGAALGSLVFTPSAGIGAPQSVDTSSTGAAKGCPTGAVQAKATVVGPGVTTPFVMGTARVSGSAGKEINVPTSFPVAQLAAGKYDVTVTCTDLAGKANLGTFTSPLWFTDATHYQSGDPANSQTTSSLGLVVSPVWRASMGTEVTLTATVDPARSAGTVQFRELSAGSYTNLGSPVTVANGRAVLAKKDFTFGLHVVSGVFTPTDAKAFTAATSNNTYLVVAKPAPPTPPHHITIGGGTPTVGSKMSCAGDFKGAKSYSVRWWRDKVMVQEGSSTSYRPKAGDRGHQIRAEIVATNEGGSTRRVSAAVRVR